MENLKNDILLKARKISLKVNKTLSSENFDLMSKNMSQIRK